MTVRTFPLNNVDYYADDVRMFHAGRTGGIVNYSGDDFAITGVSGFNVGINPGLAYLKTGTESMGGVVCNVQDSESLRLEPSSGAQRFDYISLRYDKNENDVQLLAVKGSTAMPTPVRNENIWELILYVITVPANVSALTMSNVQDVRLSESYCGLTVDTLTKIPTQALYDQFDSFMDSVEDVLSGNVAGNLLNQINGLKDDFSSLDSWATDNISEVVGDMANLKTTVSQQTTTVNTLNADVKELTGRPAIKAIGEGLQLSGGTLSTTNPPYRYGTSEPPADLMEGQIYLQIE